MFRNIFRMTCVVLFVTAGPLICETIEFGNEKARIRIINSETALWQYRIAETGKILPVEGPIFEIDGKSVRSHMTSIRQTGEPMMLRNGALEYAMVGELKDFPDLRLRMVFRIPKSNPVIRFRYELSASAAAPPPHALTKSGGADNLCYFSVPFQDMDAVREIRFSEFNEMEIREEHQDGGHGLLRS